MVLLRRIPTEIKLPKVIIIRIRWWILIRTMINIVSLFNGKVDNLILAYLVIHFCIEKYRSVCMAVGWVVRVLCGRLVN